MPALLLVWTAMTATLIGMPYMDNFRNGQPPITSAMDLLPYRWDWHHLRLLPGGLPFCMTILAILLAHEFGHYAACRLFGIDTGLPILLPGPIFSGSFGALLRIKSRVRSRAALLAVGAAGPMAGFAVALATTGYGLVHSTAMDAQTAPSLIRASAPWVMTLLRRTILASYPDIPPILQLVPHPVLVASWIGLLITAFNLLPAGKLDGGRIVYALSPRLHRITSNLTLAALLYLGTVEWIGWLFAGALLMLPSMKHPKISGQTPLGMEWLVLAPVCFAIFLLSSSTQPVTGMSLVQVLLRIHWGL